MMRINFVLVDQYLYILIDQNVSLSTYTANINPVWEREYDYRHSTPPLTTFKVSQRPDLLVSETKNPDIATDIAYVTDKRSHTV